MTTLFDLSGLLVLPLWALMIFLPKWRWTARVMSSPAVAVAPALLYLALVLPRLATVFPAVLRPSLPEIAALLGTPEGATIAWAHFLAFDLFVGRWIFLDGRERGLSALVLSPILFLTLMLGPIGFLSYLAARASAGRGAWLRGVARRAWDGTSRTSRSLAILNLAMVGVLAAAAAGLVFDGRVITGAPAWIKPAKFAISIVVYAATLSWLLGYVRGRERLVRVVSDVTAVALFVEMVVIVLQVVRGTTSHFNYATPLDTALWIVMGATIVLLWVMGMMVVVFLVRERGLPPAFAWSLRLGMFVAVVGMGLGFLMTGPTAAQRAAIAAGEAVATVGAHTVGAEDGGPGLPAVGWSTVGGDLRVAHFVGLHALQALPLLGLLVMWAGRRLQSSHQTALVWTGGLGYLGLTLLLAWQALRGQPLLAPDAATVAASAALAGAVLAAAAGILLLGRLRRGDGDDVHSTPARVPYASVSSLLRSIR